MSETKDEGRFSDGVELTRIDSKGRVLTIRQLNLREEMDLLSAAGPDDAMNRRWMMYATMIACVRMIDGRPLPSSNRRNWLMRNIDEVGSEGVAVVTALIVAESPPADDDAPDGDRDPTVPAVDPTTATAKN